MCACECSGSWAPFLRQTIDRWGTHVPAGRHNVCKLEETTEHVVAPASEKNGALTGTPKKCPRRAEDLSKVRSS